MKVKNGNLFIGFIIGIVVTTIIAYFIWPTQEGVVENTNQAANVNAVANTNSNQAVGGAGGEDIVFVVPTKASQNQIVSPRANEVITSPVAVSGNAFVFENQAVISVYDANGKELGQQSVYIHSEDVGEYGPFLTLVSFTASTTTTGKIQIWDTSEKDGSKIVLDEVEIRFK